MRHLPTHTDERNFKCEICGKAFRQLSTLSQHKAIHSDARPVSTLISHRKTHSEHKPHKCHICGKGFHQKGSRNIIKTFNGNLRNHVFTHTNERPYKCDICGKGFNQMSNLVCHKVKAHAHAEKMQYTCTICDKEFPRRFSLRSHEEYKHGIKYRQPVVGPLAGPNDQNIIKNKNVRIVQLPGDEGNKILENISSTNNEDTKTTDRTNSNGTRNLDNIKSIQIRLPIIQKIESDGKSRFAIDSGSESRQGDEYNELLDLAVQGGIQFIRATEDGGYELMTSNEARDLMVQNSHEMTMFNDEESDAINTLNLHSNNDVITGDANNQITALNSNSSRKQMLPIDSIEILEDKEMNILETRCLDERFMNDHNFLSQPKMDDFILCSKPLGIDHNGINIPEHDDEGLGVMSNHHDFINILNHKNDISGLPRDTTNCSFLYKNNSSMINNNLPFLKPNQSLSEDMIIINNTINDHAEYDSKMKLPMAFDENDHNTGMISLNRPEIKILDSENQANTKVKILGPKNHGQELVGTPYQDLKMFPLFDGLLKNSKTPLNMRDNNNLNNVRKKDVRILGKKLETDVIGGENDGVIKFMGNRKFKFDKNQDTCNRVDNGLIMSPSSVNRPVLDNIDQNCFSLQVCSPRRNKFIKSKNPLIGKGSSSPDIHFNDTRDIYNHNNNNNNNNVTNNSCSNINYTNYALPDLDT
ncbi:hypothetical protein M0802_011965 [Mischocyttarus mexicanus]|nr:hypothetical protein M0802_011965 [Mischocyttarus mexicanus]